MAGTTANSDGEPALPSSHQSLDSELPGDDSGWTLFIGLQFVGMIGAAAGLIADIAEHFPAIIYGVVFGQMALAAIGAALGPWALGKRLLVPPIWTIVLILILQGAAFSGVAIELPIVFIVVLFAVGSMFLLQLPFWALRWLGRFRINYSRAMRNEGSEAASNQFGIRALLVLTLVVAAVLGLSRAIVPHDLFVDLASTPLEQWMLPLAMLVGVAVCALAALLSALRLGEVVMAVGVATTCVILLLFAFLAAGESLGLRGGDLYEVPLGLFAHFVWTTGSLLAVRRTGLRIAHVPR